MKTIKNKLVNMDRGISSRIHSTLHSMKKGRQKGAGAVEYALILGVITLLIVGLAGGMSAELKVFFSDITTLLKDFIKKDGGGDGGG